MRCPFCSGKESKVTDSRTNDAGIRRRRECLDCRQRFSTLERVQSAPLLVSKRDGRREEFSRDKMIAGLRLACAKRPVASQMIESMVDGIEADLQQRGGNEVASETLGRVIMDRLRDLDRVAYIRFASVHRDFQEIESFEKAVRDLRDSTQQLPLLDDMAPRAKGRGRRRARAASGSDGTGGGDVGGGGDAGNNSTDSETLGEAVGTAGSDKE